MRGEIVSELQFEVRQNLTFLLGLFLVWILTDFGHRMYRRHLDKLNVQIRNSKNGH